MGGKRDVGAGMVVISQREVGLTRWNRKRIAAGMGTSSLLNSQRLLNRETPGIFRSDCQLAVGRV